MADQEYCLRWNNHQTTLTAIFDKLLQASRYTDCTISAGGQNVAAHKLLLTACSPYFDSVFSGIRDDRHAVIVLSDVTYAELRALMDYMYRGEVNISQDRLAGLLKVAEALQIRGLYEPGETQTRAPPPPAPAPPPIASSNRPRGLTIEPARRSVPNATMDFPLEASREDSSRSPVPKRRKRPTRSVDEFAPLIGDPLNESDASPLAPIAAPLAPIDKILPDGAPLLPDPPKLEREPAFEAIQPKEEYVDDHDDSIENITLDDDDDDGIDEMDQSQQPGTSHMGEGSSQGYPPSWHNSEQSNDEVFMAAQQAVGDGTQREGQQDVFTPVVKFVEGRLYSSGTFPCPNCNAVFKQKSYLNHHMKNVCGKDPQFECPLCQKRYRQKENLVIHLTNECGKANHFMCAACKKTFKQQKVLNSHVRYECGKEPQFQCPYCPHRSFIKSNLNQHIKRKH